MPKNPRRPFVGRRGTSAGVVPSRRRFLVELALAAGAASTHLLGSIRVLAQPAQTMPPGSDTPGMRDVLRGGAVLSMDPGVGDFIEADLLVERHRIAGIGPALDAGDAVEADARGMVVMPGFVDTTTGSRPPCAAPWRRSCSSRPTTRRAG